MAILICSREAIQAQIISNFIEAGIACKEDAGKIEANLNRLDARNLLAVLLESHEFKEQKLSGKKFYRFDISILGNLN